MSDPVILFVRGVPKPQPRVKAYVRGERAGVYTPGSANEWKSAVADVLTRAGVRCHGAVHISLQFRFPRPKAHIRTNGKMKDSAPFEHTQRPDLDNLAKAVLDVMTDCGVIPDDKHVVTLRLAKDWEMPGREGCRIELYSEDDDIKAEQSHSMKGEEDSDD